MTSLYLVTLFYKEVCVLSNVRRIYLLIKLSNEILVLYSVVSVSLVIEVTESIGFAIPVDVSFFN